MVIAAWYCKRTINNAPLNVSIYAFRSSLSLSEIKQQGMAQALLLTFIMESSVGFRQRQLLSLMHICFGIFKTVPVIPKPRLTGPSWYWSLLTNYSEWMIHFLDFVRCHLSCPNHGMKGRSCWSNAAILIKKYYNLHVSSLGHRSASSKPNTNTFLPRRTLENKGLQPHAEESTKQIMQINALQCADYAMCTVTKAAPLMP